jgi:23S rRNA (uracil1939-C5)-methyltransferase
MLRPGDQLSLAIEKPAAGGRMIARDDGRVVLVSGAIPGERVRARIERVAKGVLQAAVIEVEEPSPDRREPFVEPSCGGSIYSHIAYRRQLSLKAEIIADAFKRIGRLELPTAVLPAASPESGYRMRARLHVRAHRIGFFREGTHELCDVRATQQLLPATCDVLDRLSAALRSLGDDRVREIELTENVDASERVVHLAGSEGFDPRVAARLQAIDGLTVPPFVSDTLHVGDSALTLRRHVLSFFQGNRHLLRELVTHVVERVPIGATLIDFYAGVGLFAVAAAASRGASVTAVEGDAHAAEDLHANAARVGRITTIKGAVEGFIGGSMRYLRQKASDGAPLAEAVIIDPPRTGMSREALETVLRLNTPRLIYVSCDVATLARDARRIVDDGYRIAQADAFDLFPNTPHVETVVVFER